MFYALAASFASAAHVHGVASFMQKMRQAAARHLGLVVVLAADNDFYSQLPRLQEFGQDVSVQALQRLGNSLPCLQKAGRPVVHKTGLGSSAALTASAVGALLQALRAAQLPPESEAGIRASVALPGQAAQAIVAGLDVLPSPPFASADGSPGAAASAELVHRTAQLAHGLAQGKVGSGFDVASAVYGSVRYTRITAHVLQRAMDALLALIREPAPLATVVAQLHAVLADVANPSEQVWDHTVASFCLPPGVNMLVGDVCGGSETPSMVRKVLAARASTPAAAQEWAALQQLNERAVATLDQLSELASSHAECYQRVVQRLSLAPCSAWSTCELHELGDAAVAIKLKFCAAVEGFKSLRASLRYVSATTQLSCLPACGRESCAADTRLHYARAHHARSPVLMLQETWTAS